MSASISGTLSSVYTTPGFWERLWRSAGIQSVGLFIIAYFIYGYQPQVGAPADALVTFYGGERTRILIAAIFSGLAILNLMWFAAALRTTLADAGKTVGVLRQPPRARRSVDFSYCSSRRRRHWRTRSPAPEIRRSLRTQRLRMGERRVEFVSARDVGHVSSVWALARQADLERVVRGRGRGRRARLARRHHVAEWRLLGTRRCLFAIRLARHRTRMGPGRKRRSLDPKSSDACWMVIVGSSNCQKEKCSWRASTTMW